MPRLRPTKTHTSSLAASTGLLMASSVAGADFSSLNNVAAYWGQNSYGQATGPLAQQNLVTYCADTNVDIIPLAFVVQLTEGYNTRYNASSKTYFAPNETSRTNETSAPHEAGEQRMVVNFANTGNNCSIFTGTGLLDCGETIGQDIKTCQEKYGKTILLSIGGATYTEGGFASEDAAIAAAEVIWKTFGPTDDDSESTAPADEDDVVTTTVIASNPSVTTTITFTLTQSGTSATSVLNTPGLPDAVNTASVLVSSASPILTTSLSVPNGTIATTPQQQPTGTGVVLTTETSTRDTSSGPALSSATAISTGNTDMDSNTIPTMSPTAAGTTDTYSGPDLSCAPATSTGNDDADTSTVPTVNPTGLTVTNATAASNGTAFTANPTSLVNGTLLNLHTSLTTYTITGFAKATNTNAGGPSSTENVTRATSTVASSSFASVVEVSSRKVYRQAATVLRPLGDAIVDGFDIDLESTTQNFLPFVRRLRELMDADSARSYYLTAAPQCPYPDAAVSELLDSDVRFDAVFVQFYNNYCGVQSYTANTSTQTNFNFETWDTWAKNASSRWAANTTMTKRQNANPANVKVFLGVPGGATAAGSGYATPAQLGPVIEYSKKFASFGGVMMWDFSQGVANEGFISGVKRLLGTAAEEPTTISSVATTTAAPQTVTTPSETLASSMVVPLSSSEIMATSSSATEALVTASASDTLASATQTFPSSSNIISIPSSGTEALVTSTTSELLASSATGFSTSSLSSEIITSSAIDTLTTSTASELLTTISGVITSTDSAPVLTSTDASEALVTETFSTSATDAATSGELPTSSELSGSVVVPLTLTEATTSIETSQSPTEAILPSTIASTLTEATEALITESASISSTEGPISSEALTSTEAISSSLEISVTEPTETATTTTSPASVLETPSPSGDLFSSVFPTTPASTTDLVAPTGTSTSDDSATATSPSEALDPATVDIASTTSSESVIVTGLPLPGEVTDPGVTSATTSTSEMFDPTDNMGSLTPSQVSSLTTSEPIGLIPTAAPGSTSSTPDSPDVPASVPFSGVPPTTSTGLSGFETSTTTASNNFSSSDLSDIVTTSETVPSDAPTATPISPPSTDIPILRSRIVRRKLEMGWRMSLGETVKE